MDVCIICVYFSKIPFVNCSISSPDSNSVHVCPEGSIHSADESIEVHKDTNQLDTGKEESQINNEYYKLLLERIYRLDIFGSISIC